MKIYKNDGYHFEATYKGYSINIERECVLDDWYIVVIDNNGHYAYDGYWNDSWGTTMDDAISEALTGSMLPTPPLSLKYLSVKDESRN